MSLETRVGHLINERLFTIYWAGVEHFGTTDLVLHFDTPEITASVTVDPRERLLAVPNLPGELVEKLARPATEAAKHLKGGSTAFWLIVEFPDDRIVMAVNAQRVQQGGTA